MCEVSDVSCSVLDAGYREDIECVRYSMWNICCKVEGRQRVLYLKCRVPIVGAGWYSVGRTSQGAGC